MSCTNSCGIPDMEDFVGELFEFEEDDARQKPVKERKLKKQIKPKKQKVGLQQMKEFEGEADEVEFNIDTQHFNNVPGTENIFVKTFGCSHNISDSQFMIGQLAEYGYNIVDSIDKADLILINSCTVKNPSQDAFMAMVLSAKKIKKPLVVAGCVPQGDRNIADLSDVSALGVTQIDRVVEVVQETLKGNKVQLLEKKELPSLDLPKIRKNKQIQIIPINSGCLGACTYCKTVFARGKLGSYTPEALSNRVKTVIKEGVKEIWLTSEDTGAYGRDIGTNISELLVSLSKELVQQPHIMMRIGMTNPPYILDHLPTVAKFLNHPRVFSFIHIPVQSGSDVVLEKMNRQYNIANFSKVCEYLLQHVPNVTLATDIICGFPGETHEQFEETIQLVEKYNFPVVNISQFYPRPGTAAANMEKLPTHIVKERSSKITKVFHGLDKLSHMMDQVLRVWINESENIKGVKMLVGHTKNYTKVVIPFEEGLLYSQIMLKVTKVLDWHIEGQIVQRNAKPIEVPLDYMQQMGENLMNEAKHLREKKEARIKQSKAKKQALKLQKKTEEKVSVLSVQQKMIKSENEQSNIQNIQKPFVKEVPVPLPAEKISQVSTKQKTNTTTHYTPLYLGFVLFLISSILYTLGF